MVKLFASFSYFARRGCEVGTSDKQGRGHNILFVGAIAPSHGAYCGGLGLCP